MGHGQFSWRDNQIFGLEIRKKQQKIIAWKYEPNQGFDVKSFRKCHLLFSHEKINSNGDASYDAKPQGK